MERDNTVFPAQSYKESVLEPLFNDFKAHFYNEMMAINYAHAVMLSEQKIITEDEAKAIIRSLKEIEDEIELDSLEYTGKFEDVFFYVEQELIKKIGISVAGKLHTGRSRNDMDVTMYKMKLKGYLSSLLNHLSILIQTLIDIAEKNKKTIVIAYTHGQPAQPTTFAHYLGALIEILERDFDRLLHSYTNLDKCSMGAAAITTTGFDLNRKRMAELLGFSKVQENSYGCIAAVDYLTELYSGLKILFINLGRFVQDLGQWTGFDVSYLYVPNEFVQISSIMPQKRNPVPVEHLRIQSSMTIGYCDTVINSMHNTPFTDMNDAEDPIQVVGFDAFITGERVLKLLKDFIAGVTVNEERVRAKIEESYVTITELADSLVREEGISFRQAHEVTAELVKKLLASRILLSDVNYDTFVEIFKDVIHREPKIEESQLKLFIKPEYFVEIRECFGGPGSDAFNQSLSHYKSVLNKYREKHKKLLNEKSEAQKKLHKYVKKYL